jgi:CheY-like chemotaxis protein
LIVCADLARGRSLIEAAGDCGFVGLMAQRGDTGVALAHRAKPRAIVVDLDLPVFDGLRVLHYLKGHARTRQVPVCIVSANGRVREARLLGALPSGEAPGTGAAAHRGLFAKLRSWRESTRRVLVVDADAARRGRLLELLPTDRARPTGASPDDATQLLRDGQRFEFVVATSVDWLAGAAPDLCLGDVPILVYSDRAIADREVAALERLRQTSLVACATSEGELLERVLVLLHAADEEVGAGRRAILDVFRKHSRPRGKVLVVDDDLRNIFAITSVLESGGFDVVFAENGRDALELLQRTPDVGLVLTDVMMPEMDGYETMRAVRTLPVYGALPIIALTAKAMKEDRDKCIEAGASDYITKPVDAEELLALVRVWV